MAKRKVPPGDLAKDMAAQDAIGELTDFAPGNPKHTYAELDIIKQRLLAKQAVEEGLERALQAARDDTADVSWEYHDAIKGSKTSVKGQYGENSNQAQSVGYKKADEIQRGRRKKTDEPS